MKKRLLNNGKPDLSIVVLSQRKAKDFVCETPWAAIQIATHKDDFPKLNKCQLQCTLQLVFPDFDKAFDCPIIGPEGTTYEKISKSDLFSEKHAVEICDFVNYSIKHRGCTTLLVHCQAGVSRSPAVAAALSKVLLGDANTTTQESTGYTFVGNGDDSEYFGKYRPNMHVYRTLLNTAMNYVWFA